MPQNPTLPEDFSPRFKNASGVFYTQAMFFEWSDDPRPNCIYTLKRNDHKGYPSLRRLYLECEDPTNYLFAEKHLGGWDHFLKLMELEWFNVPFSEWERELEIKLQAKALNRLITYAEDSSVRNFVDVNKFLLQRGWKDNSRVRGAPTKAEIRQAAISIAKDTEMVSSEALRVLENTSIDITYNAASTAIN